MCFLNTPSCAILKNLNQDDYLEAVGLIRHLILITDIANHCKEMPQMEAMSEPGVFDKDNKDHQMLLLGLMMTCCDLNQVTKPNDTALAVSKLIYKEFHEQGDHEKAKGHTPHPMMDREKCNPPKEQIGFIQFLALPAFKVLSSVIPEAHPTVDSINELLQYWMDKQ